MAAETHTEKKYAHDEQTLAPKSKLTIKMSCNKYIGEGTLTTTLFLLYKETMIENTHKLKDPMWQHPYLLILSL